MNWLRVALVASPFLFLAGCYLAAIIIARRHRMPKKSRPATKLPAEGGTITYDHGHLLRIGHGDHGPVYWNVAAYPHLAVAGVTGWGKTNTLNSLIREAISHGWEVQLVDPKDIEFVGFTGHPGVREIASDADQIRRVVKWARDEMKRRARAHKAAVLRGDPPPKPRPLLLVIDEVTEMVDITDEKNRNEAVKDIASLARMGRALDVHCVFSTQQFNASEGLPTSVRRQCDAQLALGGIGRIGRQMLGWSEEQDCVPADAPKGRASFVCGSGGRPRLLQVDYADPPKPVVSGPPGSTSPGTVGGRGNKPPTTPNPAPPAPPTPAPPVTPVVPSAPTPIFGEWNDP